MTLSAICRCQIEQLLVSTQWTIQAKIPLTSWDHTYTSRLAAISAKL